MLLTSGRFEMKYFKSRVFVLDLIAIGLGILIAMITGCATVKEKCGETPDGDSYCVMYTQSKNSEVGKA